jgi:hypothetical protein
MPLLVLLLAGFRRPSGRGNPADAGRVAALSAPLIGLVGADGFGVHLFEQSSAGKTTTANIASSLWGEPDALRLTWYGTALGIANEAEAHNDSLLPLDEVGGAAVPKMLPRLLTCLTVPESCRSQRGRQSGA